MAKRKVYAVRKGKAAGVFETWEECRASVEGCPGAEYKSFATREEAFGYLGKSIPPDDGAPSGEMTSSGDGALSGDVSGCVDLHGQEWVTAYVDGSFDEKIGRYAFGCVLILPDGEIIREFGNGDNPESLALRNVTGEMLGAMFAVKWCVENGYRAVKVCYDYSGIEMWATSRWRAKTDLTRKYADFMRAHAGKIELTFQKIAAHTGNQYNEEADRLAKAALTEANGIPKIRKL